MSTPVLPIPNYVSPPLKYLYKILPSKPPSPLPITLPLSDLDISSGYIHLSTARQVSLTAERFFGEVRKLWVLRLKFETFDEGMANGIVVMETVTLGDGESDTFPHLYKGKLGRDVVEDVLEFQREESWSAVLGGLES